MCKVIAPVGASRKPSLPLCEDPILKLVKLERRHYTLQVMHVRMNANPVIQLPIGDSRALETKENPGLCWKCQALLNSRYPEHAVVAETSETRHELEKWQMRRLQTSEATENTLALMAEVWSSFLQRKLLLAHKGSSCWYMALGRNL